MLDILGYFCHLQVGVFVCVCMHVLVTVALFLMVLLTFLSLSFSPSVLPAFVEILLFIAVFGLKKKPL